MWEWYEWNSLEDFNTWHEIVKEQLGLPKPGINQATGTIDENAVWTTDYTSVIEIEGKFIGIVEDDFNSGLIATELRPPVPNIGL